MSRRKSNWPDLPPELLSQITNRLENRPDIPYSRAVCKDWHRSVSLSLLSNKTVLSPILPHKLTNPNPPLLKYNAVSELKDYYSYLDDEISVNSFILVSSSVFIIKPVNNLSLDSLLPWVVTVEEVNAGELCLRRPFTRSAVVDKTVFFPKVLDLSRFEVEEMGKMYSLRFDKKPNYLFEEGHKVLLMGKADCETVSTIDDCIAIVWYDSGALSAIKLKDESVTQLLVKARKFDDIVMYKGMVYVVDRFERIYYIDNSSSDRLTMVNVVESELKYGGTPKSRCRLVESCGELYLVRKCLLYRTILPRTRMGVRVCKLDQELMKWVEVDSIGDDRILFVTCSCCFFARASDFSGWKGNCVVFHHSESFSRDVQPSWYKSFPGDYEFMLPIGGDKLNIDVFRFDGSKIELIKSDSPYSAVFWPPPKWVYSDATLPDSLKSEEGDVKGTEAIAAPTEGTKAKAEAQSDGLELGLDEQRNTVSKD